ncbi:hypothetical protein ONZ45_g14294 [Pleurotus djamor]|nr:hypothetical protein ONZ45_g14294 [Pleurotus djamor]
MTPNPPRRVFGIEEGTPEEDAPSQNQPSPSGRLLGRLSFGGLRRPSFLRRDEDGDHGEGGSSERPPVPTVMQSSGEVYATPLPVLSMIVLSITMLGEFLSANVSTPFLLFMVKGFGAYDDDAEVAFWTGIIVSGFFLTQFLTSLLWATVAEKHGRRTVLIVSLLGSAVTCAFFGTSTSIQQALCIRLLQGVFAGAVGVARGSVAFITDASNEGRAYAILGFCWGFGGVAGAIIGGAFERPAVKWPSVFRDIDLFVTYPYLLPCVLAAAITFTGSILACFLGHDGGPRHGSIRLLEKPDTHIAIPEEDSPPPSPLDDDLPQGFAGSLRRKISKRFSGSLSWGTQDRHPQAPSPQVTSPKASVPLTLTPSWNDQRSNFSRTSRANGSAYGYSGNFRTRLGSNFAPGSYRSSAAHSLRRRGSQNAGGRAMSSSEGSDLNFAQRLLMANENAVTNIADLWVAAAMNVDNEDPFDMDLDEEEVVEEEEVIGSPSSPRGRLLSSSRFDTPLGPRQSASRHTSALASSSRPRLPSRSSLTHNSETSMNRRMSTPSIFAHTGVRTPSAVLDAQQLLLRTELESPHIGDVLPPITESRQPSESSVGDLEALQESQPSLANQLPLMIIAQYGLLALHSTTHDQVFMSYLVSDYQGGGLNLNPGRFAQLIALMCLAQIAYQFYLYPNMGPPRGRFSHLAMFRIGSILFIPSYLTVILYRPFASATDDGSFIVMAGLAISTAVRFCAITFAYTAISILLNYMTPPHAVGFANGIAQSISTEYSDKVFNDTTGDQTENHSDLAPVDEDGDSVAASESENASASLQTRSRPHTDLLVDFMKEADGAIESLPEWKNIKLHGILLHHLRLKQFTSPTPIQASAIPYALSGRDVIGVAETGSGKTLAYGLPILQYIISEKQSSNPGSPPYLQDEKKRALQALILAPTRELALQVTNHLKDCVSEYQSVADRAVAESSRNKPPSAAEHYLSSTPGRLWDTIQDDESLAREIRQLRFLVLDEADRMIEQGHFAELDNILRLTLRENTDDKIDDQYNDAPSLPDPSPDAHRVADNLQTFVFSATLSKNLQHNLSKRRRPRSKVPAGKGKKGKEEPASTLDDLLERLDFRDPEPQVIDLSPQGGIVSTLRESKIECLANDKDVYLYYFLLRYPGRTLVFLSAIDGIRRLTPLLQTLDVKVLPIHSQMEQRARLKNLDRFKSTPNAVLLATDVAARGLDIPSIDHVIHYQIPKTADTYVHRNGRTARAKREGVSLLLCAPEERKIVRALMSSLERDEDIPELSIELNILDKLKARIQLAKKIESAHHKTTKENHERKWLTEAAEAMEIKLDDDMFASDSDDQRSRNSKHARKVQNSKTAQLKAELKRMLAQPLVARGVSTRYITSGSRPIVDDMLAGETNETLIGLKKTAAGADIDIARQKKSKRPQLKSRVYEEWNGISST